MIDSYKRIKTMGEEMALHFTKLSTNDDIFDKTSATKLILFYFARQVFNKWTIHF